MTFVTIWRIGIKKFHTCHQKNCSDGDGLRGFTIESTATIITLLQYVVEGVLMLGSVCVGVIFNIASVVFFVKQRSHRTFHRLLLMLAIVDTVHLVTSLLSFSLPTLFPTFLNTTYKYTLPYTLPLAQVCKSCSQEIKMFLY